MEHDSVMVGGVARSGFLLSRCRKEDNYRRGNSHNENPDERPGRLTGYREAFAAFVTTIGRPEYATHAPFG
jgi:hypothetical protein